MVLAFKHNPQVCPLKGTKETAAISFSPANHIGDKKLPPNNDSFNAGSLMSSPLHTICLKNIRL